MQTIKPDHITQENWDAVDVPELTDEELKQMRPMREVMPEMVEAYLRGDFNKPPLIHPSKQRITIRLDSDVVRNFKTQAKQHGGSYQAEINAALRQHIQQRELIQVLTDTVRQTIHEELKKAA